MQCTDCDLRCRSCSSFGPSIISNGCECKTGLSYQGDCIAENECNSTTQLTHNSICFGKFCFLTNVFIDNTAPVLTRSDNTITIRHDGSFTSSLTVTDVNIEHGDSTRVVFESVKRINGTTSDILETISYHPWLTIAQDGNQGNSWILSFENYDGPIVDLDSS